MNLPILYSFRRCPYAMRARMALAYAGISVIHREVDLKNKPQELLSASPKGTVPVLVLENQVIEESMEILFWALEQNTQHHVSEVKAHQTTQADQLLHELLNTYLPAMHRFKYPDRFDIDNTAPYQEVMEIYFQQLNKQLQNNNFLFGDLSFVDIAIFPLIRQGAIIDHDYWRSLPLPDLKAWYEHFLNSPEFISAMQKFPVWIPGADVLVNYKPHESDESA